MTTHTLQAAEWYIVARAVAQAKVPGVDPIDLHLRLDDLVGGLEPTERAKFEVTPFELWVLLLALLFSPLTGAKGLHATLLHQHYDLTGEWPAAQRPEP